MRSSYKRLALKWHPDKHGDSHVSKDEATQVRNRIAFLKIYQYIMLFSSFLFVKLFTFNLGIFRNHI